MVDTRMRFLYDENAGIASLEIEGESYRHIFRARRTKKETLIYLRNLKDDKIYKYHIETVGRKSALLRLVDFEHKRVGVIREIHIGWCIIEPKSIEKALPYLNEIGVKKITFIRCDKSQKEYRLDYKRIKKILLASSQQCGRSDTIEIVEFFGGIGAFLEEESSDVYLLDFGGRGIDSLEDRDKYTVIVGCEGGFSEAERSLFDREKTIGFNTPVVYRSETAAIVFAGKLLG